MERRLCRLAFVVCRFAGSPRRAGFHPAPFIIEVAQIILQKADLPDLILDRVLHHANTINIRGISYRFKEKLKAGLIRTEEPAAIN